MDPSNVHNADGMGYGIVITGILMAGGMLILFVWGILAVSALLGLTSFSVMGLLRKKRPEEPEEAGLDDLF